MSTRHGHLQDTLLNQGGATTAKMLVTYVTQTPKHVT